VTVIRRIIGDDKYPAVYVNHVKESDANLEAVAIRNSDGNNAVWFQAKSAILSHTELFWPYSSHAPTFLSPLKT
jgi:hypothetical protein